MVLFINILLAQYTFGFSVIPILAEIFRTGIVLCTLLARNRTCFFPAVTLSSFLNTRMQVLPGGGLSHFLYVC